MGGWVGEECVKEWAMDGFINIKDMYNDVGPGGGRVCEVK
jgi:hypothetical protein